MREELRSCKEQLEIKSQTISTQQATIDCLSNQIQDLKKMAQAAKNIENDLNPKDSLTLQNNVKVLVDDQVSEGHSYDYTQPFDHPANREMTARIRKDFIDADGQKCKFSGDQISRACKKYFNNRKRSEKRKVNGTNDKHLYQSRSYRRKNTKLNKRKEAFNHPQVKLTHQQRQMAHEMLYTVGLSAVSSDEDGYPSSDEEVTSDRRRKGCQPPAKVRKTFKLPWESLETTGMKSYLDNYHEESIASVKSKSQKWTIIKNDSCPVSNRPRPKNLPSWMEKVE